MRKGKIFPSFRDFRGALRVRARKVWIAWTVWMMPSDRPGLACKGGLDVGGDGYEYEHEYEHDDEDVRDARSSESEASSFAEIQRWYGGGEAGVAMEGEEASAARRAARVRF
jgi:hypothetical protein